MKTDILSFHKRLFGNCENKTMKHYKVGNDIRVHQLADRLTEKIDTVGFPKAFWVLGAIALSYLIGQTIFLFTTR